MTTVDDFIYPSSRCIQASILVGTSAAASQQDLTK